MLTGFRVQNFKNLRDVSAEFGPINAIVGPNGAGKSSLLQAIDFLRAFFESSVEVYFDRKGWDYRDIPNVHEKGKITRWTAHAELTPENPDALAGRYEYTVHLQPKRYPTIGHERLVVTANGSEPEEVLTRRGTKYALLNRQTGMMESFVSKGLPASVMSALDEEEDGDKYPELFAFRDWVKGFRSFLLWDPQALRAPSRGEYDELGPAGEHLSAVISDMAETRPDDAKQLVGRLRRLFPMISGITVRPKKWGWLELEMKEAGHTLNSRQMSDGILRLLAVTSFAYSESLPTLLSLEEPENGVHPRLLSEVVAILGELTRRKTPHPCQVFFTSHSPYVIDEFVDSPEHVYLMARRGDEGAAVQRLSELPSLEAVRSTYEDSLGEAWFTGLLDVPPKGERG